ncbi:hypothetical protein BV22DRAFT_924088 [Leucogyrophana mollusca]|uniref:Uncharacterized protein n=1 Tax=Leucogyrophana mollusca TaxID=85980 RepID=A0ACB8AY13_9AGAM|nr:hypothetical protein BV22DRAFT_924088 [Leucogyrophana mollusca]
MVLSRRRDATRLFVACVPAPASDARIYNACVRVEGPQPLAQWHPSRKKLPLGLAAMSLGVKHHRDRPRRKFGARPLTFCCIFPSHHHWQIIFSPCSSDGRPPRGMCQ